MIEPQPADRERLARLSRAFALLAGVIAVLVLAGWTLALEPLKRIAPGLSAMNPMTAVSFLCAAATLLLQPDAGRAAALRFALPLVLVGIGGAKLLDIYAGTGLHLDRALFESQLGVGSVKPNQMAPNTALCLFLLGIALLTARRRSERGVPAGHLIVIPIVLLALLAIVGYLYENTGLYQLQAYNPMALHSAIAFLLCSLSLALVQPDRGFIGLLAGPSEAGRIARVLLPACLLLPITLGWFALAGLRLDLYGLGTAISVLVLLIVLVLCAVVLMVATRMEGEEALRKRADAVIAAKTAELVSANAQLVAANAAKASFLSSMSHEIRTPMNAVIGMTSLLLNSKLTAEQLEFAETIRSSGDHLLSVINEILDFSKLEAQRMSIEKSRFDLRAAVEDAIDLVAPEAARKDIELAFLIAPEAEGHYLGDVGRVRQVLLNLLSNAIKFTERGEVVLHVVARPAGDARELHFSVHDTGIGIPADRLPQLFQPFTQVDATTTRKYGGTGLGLAISRRLAELMGGRAWAESHAGHGSTFHFTILAAHVEGAPLPAPAVPLAGKRLLAVDDNRTNLRILEAYARGWGMECVAESSPASALERLRSGERFDVALLDYQMPGLDGFALGLEFRRLPAGERLPLVLLSSATLSRPDLTVREPRFAEIAMKPIKPAPLAAVLSAALGAVPPLAIESERRHPTLNTVLGALNPLRILLVEDNAVNQKVATRLLEKLGYPCDVAGTGLEALQAVARQVYDVVFMDVQMPDMDGLTATRTLVANAGRGARPRIVGMTANATEQDRQECMDAGMDDYLSKPVTVPQLIAALQRCARRPA